MSGPSDRRDDALRRHRDAAAAAARLVGGRFADLGTGFSVRTDELPLVYSLNIVDLDEVGSAEELASVCEAHQGDLGFRHALVRGPSGPGIEGEMAAWGWRIERDVVMALEADRFATRSVGHGTQEIAEGEMTALMSDWLREEMPSIPAERLAEVLEYNRRLGRALQERRFGVLDDDGATPLAIAKSRARGGFGIVEDVFVAAPARGRGLGRAVVEAAVRSLLDAGCDVVSIVADADDWPQLLYTSIGFAPIGIGRVFHLDFDAG